MPEYEKLTENASSIQYNTIPKNAKGDFKKIA